MPGPADDTKRKAARETIDILHEISTLLVNLPLRIYYDNPAANRSQNTNLDRQSLSYCVSLIENGVNPEALAVSRLIPVVRPPRADNEAERDQRTSRAERATRSRECAFECVRDLITRSLGFTAFIVMIPGFLSQSARSAH